MRIVILALGSRGDTQPCVALGLALRQAGHHVRIIAADDFAGLVQSRGIEFLPAGMAAHEMLDSRAAQMAMASGRNTLQAIRQILAIFVPVFERIMEQTWQACQTADALVYSTLAFGVYHVAEKLGIPCFWALSMPIFGRTRVWPNLLVPIRLPLGGGYNWLTHRLIEQFFCLLVGQATNQWRRERLGLAPLPRFHWPYGEMNGRPVPCLYHLSPTVVQKPPDWGDPIHITGYWFLDHLPGWQPPAKLARFLDAGLPPVYIGFGSMSSYEPQATARLAAEALRLCGQPGVLLTGGYSASEEALPAHVCAVGDVPHDWLFPRMAAVVHHGGSGTTGAGLRAGVPNIVVPFAGDQPFWAGRVHALGSGPPPIPRKRLTAERLAEAIQTAFSDDAIRQRAAEIGRQIQAEEGARRASDLILLFAGETASDLKPAG